MRNSLDDAKEEMKRVDHLIMVSLKYTRTVDVLLNVINRMIDGYDFLFEALIKLAVEQKREDHVSNIPLERGNQVKALFPEDLILDAVDLYFLLRKLYRSNPVREHEYRRNVTMRTVVEGREEFVTIDIITSYYDEMIRFLRRVEEVIKEYHNEHEEKDSGA